MSIVINNPGGSGGGSSFNYAFPMGTNLPNAKFVSGQAVISSATDTDLYTVPSNKRAFVLGWMVNNPGSSASVSPEFKISSTYYPLVTAGTGNNFYVPFVPYVAEAGESFSINTASATTTSAYVSVIEFDNTANLKSVKITSFINGNNTVYTVPAAKTAFLVPMNLLGQPQGSTTSPSVGSEVIGYANASGSSRSIQMYQVPSGQSVGTNYSVAGSFNVANGTSNGRGFQGALNTGDFIVINSNASTASQLGWVTVIEM